MLNTSVACCNRVKKLVAGRPRLKASEGRLYNEDGVAMRIKINLSYLQWDVFIVLGDRETKSVHFLGFFKLDVLYKSVVDYV